MFASRLLALSIFALPAVAGGDELVDEGFDHLHQARFREAREAFDRASAGEDLTREELARLLEGRALVAQAVADDAALRVAMAMLAAIDPDHHFGSEVPPELRTAFETARREHPRPLEVGVEAERREGRVHLRAFVREAPAELVRSLRIWARRPGHEWRQMAGPEVAVEAARAEVLEHWVEAIGPGGAVIGRAGSRGAPLRSTPVPLIAPAESNRRRSREGGGGALPWIVVGVGAIGVGVVVAILATSGGGDDRTHVGNPEWTPP